MCELPSTSLSCWICYATVVWMDDGQSRLIWLRLEVFALVISKLCNWEMVVDPLVEE